ncbi:MAG: hypothetical protein AAF481_02870 [Acidobacteriota bacterium]
MAPSEPGSFPSQPGTFSDPFQYTRDLPRGTWNLMINGRVYTLDVRHVSASGRVQADLSSGTVEKATWDGIGTASIAGKLAFVRVSGDIRQQYEGWLFQYAKLDPLWRMAGTVVHLDDSGARSGWYGTLPRRS